MNKQLDLHLLKDPLFAYYYNSSSSSRKKNSVLVPLEEFSDELTKYELLRLDTNFIPFRITVGCLSSKKIDKLIELLIRKNLKIKALNLSNCDVSLNDIKKLKQFKNLVSLNLSNSLSNVKESDMSELVLEISKLNLKLLDISNNAETSLYKYLKPIENINTLTVLSIEEVLYRETDDLRVTINLDFSKLTSLKELDVSENKITVEQLQQISTLTNLKLLYISNIDDMQIDRYDYIDFILLSVKKLTNLKFLDISTHITHLTDSNDFLWNSNARYNNGRLIINKLPKLKKLKITGGFENETINTAKIIINNKEIELIY